MNKNLIIKENKNKEENKEEKDKSFRLKKFAVATFGCKTNQSESDEIIRELLSSGFEIVEYDENPDFIIINTCTVTSMADKKARQFIRKIKQNNPAARIIVTGCFVNFNDEFLKNEGINDIFLNENKNEISDFIKKEYGCNVYDKNEKSKLNLTGKHTREFIKIQDGCEQKCTYCIIPYVRGKYKSENPDKIIYDINSAVNNDIDEIVLTGIHIGKYGADFKYNDELAIDNIKFSDLNLKLLLELLLNKTGIKRIRLSSIEINEITDDLLLLIKNSNQIAKHLHIPLQSASDKILKNMGRPYNKSYFYEKINKIKKIIPDVTITTDIIAGFPGESEEDFNETLMAAKEINFSKIHVFKYSQRKFTPAALMNSQVKEEIKNERSFKLRKLAGQLRKDYINKNIGKTLNVAIENINYVKGYASGMSENYIKIYIPVNKNDTKIKIGKIFNIKADYNYLEGLKGSFI